MFVDPDGETFRFARMIMEEFPGLVDPDKETPDADPFVVALGMVMPHRSGDLFESTRYIVVTSEKPSRLGGRPKIPDACRRYGIDCIFGSTAILEFFRNEDWRF